MNLKLLYFVLQLYYSPLKIKSAMSSPLVKASIFTKRLMGKEEMRAVGEEEQDLLHTESPSGFVLRIVP